MSYRDACPWHLPFRWSLLLGCSGIGLIACARTSTVPSPALPSAPVEAGVRFGAVTLTQRSEAGDLLWKFEAQGVTYGADQSVAQVNNIQGYLYEQGEPVFKLQSSRGEVEQEGQRIRLRGAVVATELRHQVVFRGRDVEWRPESGYLQVRSGLNVSHPKVQLWAQQLQAFSRTNQIKVQGNVVIEGRQPGIRLKADQAIWRLETQEVRVGRRHLDRSSPSVDIEQLAPQQRHRAIAGEVQLNLRQQQLTLQDPAQITLVQPAIMITSQRLIWDLAQQRLRSPQLLEVRHLQQQVDVIAEQGLFDQKQQLAQLKGRVEAQGKQNNSRLSSHQLTWNLNTQQLEALGNVQYQQQSPAFALKGQRAIGQIQAQTIQISGGTVVTEIFP